MKKSLNNQGGFSLVQVMVAFGLMGALAVMMMKMTENQNKQQKTFELKAETGDMQALIRQTLFDKEACEATFIGMSPGDNITSIRTVSDMSQPPFAEAGVKFKSFNVYIKEMYLLTRAEEVTFKQRDAALKPVSYQTGMGYGYLRVTFVKNIGAVNDANKSHNFFGSKESAVIFPVKGYFYDMEIVKSNMEDQLDDACYAKAAAKGLSCNGTAGEPCLYVKIDESPADGNSDFVTDLDGTKVYIGECRYYRDDSPFMSCAN